ncbi:MAG: chorismate synthase [Candidatus Peregrinibacteria bacterium]|nr:chorismate synthase [Candidatus Peregrinibacteria bacterium]
MAGSSFGKLFTISTWGESHGPALGVVIDGCPAGLKISEKEIQKELDRRRPGQSEITTPRKESDSIRIMSGIFEGLTTGTPISLMIENKDHVSRDYSKVAETYRPSHADFTYDAKYGIRDYRGSGRASARETAGRVAAGAIAKKILKSDAKVEILAYVKQVREIRSDVKPEKLTAKQIESNAIRCPDAKAAKKMIALVEKMKKAGDSVGGIIECVIRNVPAGLGSPVFDKLEARLAQAMLSLPATKGFEIGSGFDAILMTGSQHNDPLSRKGKKIVTTSNRSGGVVGGISNGMDIIFRVAFKPTATIFKKQKTVTSKGKDTYIQMSGRHDPCVLPRAVPIVEAMAALVLADEYLIQKTVKI